MHAPPGVAPTRCVLGRIAAPASQATPVRTVMSLNVYNHAIMAAHAQHRIPAPVLADGLTPIAPRLCVRTHALMEATALRPIHVHALPSGLALIAVHLSALRLARMVAAVSHPILVFAHLNGLIMTAACLSALKDSSCRTPQSTNIPHH